MTSQTFLAACPIALSQSLVQMAVQHSVISLGTALFAANLQQCGTVIFPPAWDRLLLCFTAASYLKILTMPRVTDQILVQSCPCNCSVHTPITIFKILSALKYLLLSKVKKKINITKHFPMCQ